MQTFSEIEVNIQNHFQFDSLSNWATDRPIDCETIEPRTWQSWFQIWLSNLSVNLPEAGGYELTLRLTSDSEIQTLNAQYRDRSVPTDVLAFATLELDIPQFSNPVVSVEPLYIGDIVISVETAWKQAQEQNHSLKKELVWLASHGFLHLLGWDHQDDSSLLLMLAQQERLVQSIENNF
jgi:probable rRNA maturation factor